MKFSPAELILAIGLATTIALVARKLRLLDAGGAVAAFFIGSIIFYAGGLLASVILILFFVTSSLLTRLPRTSSVRLEEEGKHPRNWLQAVANGGAPALAMLVLLFRPDLREETTAFFLGAIACATADTWATEIGTRYGGRVYHIVTLREHVPGASGGVTGRGLLASLLGALLIGLLSRLSLPYSYLCELQMSPSIAIATVAGFAGALIDSVLGATVQERFQCTVCGVYTERPVHCGAQAIRIGGIRRVSNDVVNAISCFWSGILALGLLSAFG